MRYAMARRRNRQLAYNSKVANAQKAARAINARAQQRDRDDVRVAQTRHRDALIRALESTQWRSELTG